MKVPHLQSSDPLTCDAQARTRNDQRGAVMNVCIEPTLAEFAEIRSYNSYYVDKTGFLEEFLLPIPAKVALFTRPRRFGKSLMMSMMAEFFDITKDSRKLFEGLAVTGNTALCREWMNQYPVLSLTLKGIEEDTYELACSRIAARIADQLRTVHRCLLTSPRLISATRNELQALSRKEAGIVDVEGSLHTLCIALNEHYGKPPVLLIDEYDVPVAKAQENGFYEKMIKFMRNFLSDALKGNTYLKFAILTGCLRITRESLFTGLNNLNCFGISQDMYSDCFGFTETEVQTMLSAFGMAEKMNEVREWYDGYRFGEGKNIYCPWGITNYVADHMRVPGMAPQPYWLNTSGNEISRDVLRKKYLRLGENIETLIQGGCIEVSLKEQMNYSDLYDSADHFWTLMYLTGYLTRASEEQCARCDILPEDGETALAIPNREISQVWKMQVQRWLAPELLTLDTAAFETAFWDGDADGVAGFLQKTLLEKFSFLDFGEYGYHIILLMLFHKPSKANSNRESGFGRYDIAVRNRTRNMAAIIEVKRARGEEELEQLAGKALQQIEQQKYDTSLRTEHGFTNILHWGIAFYGKVCRAQVRTLHLQS